MPLGMTHDGGKLIFKGKVWNEQGLTYTLLTFSSFSFLYLSKCIIYGFKTLRTIETLQLQHDKNSLGFFCAIRNFQIFKIQNNFFKYVYIKCHKNIKVFFPHSISNISVNCKVSDSNIVWCERYKKEKSFVRGK
jgi:hypothetical protein